MESHKYLEILHFNDVYKLTEGRAVQIENSDVQTRGGAPRFVTAMKKYGCDQKLVLFSGDLLAPSLLSNFHQGHQFVEVFNALNVKASCLGNHDVFDYGVDNFLEFIKKSDKLEKDKNTWLMANFFVKKVEGEKKAIAGLKGTHIIDQKNGTKIGIIGLCDDNWKKLHKNKKEVEEPSTEDFVDVAKKLSMSLRGDGCQYIIALTHMMTQNDRKLAQSGKGFIDLILGGHEHHSIFEKATENKVCLIKSGSDFQEFSDIKVNLIDGTIERERVLIDLKRESFHEDPQILKVIEDSLAKVKEDLKENLAYVDMKHFDKKDNPGLLKFDNRKFRTEENAISNLLADIVLTEPENEETEVVLLNGGTFRGTGDWEKSEENKFITIGDLYELLALEDNIVQLKVRGQVIKAALEHSVSDGEMKDQEVCAEEENNDDTVRLDGKFLSGVSGLDFTWDPKLPSGNRVTKVMMWPKTMGELKKEELDLENKKWYVIKILEYMAKGGDGYSCFEVEKKADKVGGQTPGDEEIKGEPGDQTIVDKKTKEVPQVERIGKKDARSTILKEVLEALKQYRFEKSKYSTLKKTFSIQEEQNKTHTTTVLQPAKSEYDVGYKVLLQRKLLKEKRQKLLKINNDVPEQGDPSDKTYIFKKIHPSITGRITKLNN